jgi:FdhD protein
MTAPEQGWTEFSFALLRPDRGPATRLDRKLIREAPIAIEYNGIGYAVMMATPIELDDFVIGFSLSEQLVASAEDIQSIATHRAEKGWIVRVQLPAQKAEKVYARARQRVSESSCGLCGMDNLDEVMRELPAVTARLELEKGAVFAALNSLRSHQHLNAATGAAHAAAFCAPDGKIMLMREDVGRHNALDKLLGAIARLGGTASSGFILLTARCSFELVQKAILANCPALVTISAASDLAAETAARNGLHLISLARQDSALSAWPQSD